MFPRSGRSYTQVFNTCSTVTNLQWSTWQRPRGTNFASIVCIGGGGGGSGGFTRTAGSNGAGGGGGGGSPITSIVVPLFMLPDTLYVQVGVGGAGGSAGGAGSTGIISYVTVFPSFQSNNIIIASGNSASGGAGAPTATVGGTVGAAGAVAIISNMCMAGIGFWNSIAPAAGVAGGNNNVAGTSINLYTASTSGGCGGAGITSTNLAGGSYTVANVLAAQCQSAAPAAGSVNGPPGPNIMFTDSMPFFLYGGCGGSSSNTGVGGNGGQGSYGCGGGGGGAGTTGGRGGDGGNGIVIITAW